MRSVTNAVMTAVRTRVTKNVMPAAVPAERPGDRGKGRRSKRLKFLMNNTPIFIMRELKILLPIMQVHIIR